jgi:hypothetical protein
MLIAAFVVALISQVGYLYSARMDDAVAVIPGPAGGLVAIGRVPRRSNFSLIAFGADLRSALGRELGEHEKIAGFGEDGELTTYDETKLSGAGTSPTGQPEDALGVMQIGRIRVAYGYGYVQIQEGSRRLASIPRASPGEAFVVRPRQRDIVIFTDYLHRLGFRRIGFDGAVLGKREIAIGGRRDERRMLWYVPDRCLEDGRILTVVYISTFGSTLPGADERRGLRFVLVDPDGERDTVLGKPVAWDPASDPHFPGDEAPMPSLLRSIACFGDGLVGVLADYARLDFYKLSLPRKPPKAPTTTTAERGVR